MKQRKFTNRHRNLLLGLLVCAAAAAAFWLLARQGIGIPCLLREITGFSCPGCGNSRAVLALLSLDVPAALRYNLLFPAEFFYLGWVLAHCCKSYLKGGRFSYRPPWAWLDIILLALVLLWWPLRNILGI